jgi:MFS family permease
VFTADLAETPKSAGYGFGSSVTEAGVILAPQAIGVIIVGALIGRLTARIGAKMILLLGALTCTAAMMLEAFAHDQKWQLELSMAIVGAGIIMLVAAQANISVTAVPPAQTGVSAGMNANIRLIGGSIGTAVMASIVTSTATQGGLPAESGYVYGFLTLALAAGAGAVVSLFVPSPNRRAARRALEAGAAGLTGSASPTSETKPNPT